MGPSCHACGEPDLGLDALRTNMGTLVPAVCRWCHQDYECLEAKDW